MPHNSLTSSPSMTFTQRWPEQGWALLQVLLVASFSLADEPECRKRGDPENSQLLQDGDIMLGGLFSFHTNWIEKQEAYVKKATATTMHKVIY